jgi:hypothetical protein
VSAAPAAECCFRHCTESGAASLRLELSPPPDAETVTLRCHEECFAAPRNPSVDFDDPRDHGHIPPKARCAFCGETLPVVGTHPFVFDVGDFSPPHRYWTHAPCLLERLVPALAQRLDVTGSGTSSEGGTA